MLGPFPWQQSHIHRYQVAIIAYRPLKYGSRSIPITYSLCRCDLAREDLGDPKVSYLNNCPLLIQQDILGLEIAVENIERVDVVDGYEDLHKHLQDVLQMEDFFAVIVKRS